MSRLQLAGLSIFSGILLSLPWLAVLPGWILFIALVPLFIVEEEISKKPVHAAGIEFWNDAWLCFLTWNGLSTWWILYATVTGAILASVLNAALMATVWWLFHLLKRRFKPLAFLGLTVFWISFEYLHLNWELHWPWLTLGNGFANDVKLIQWYEYTGVLGGTLWIILINILIFRTYKQLVAAKRKIAGLFFLLTLIILIPSFWSVKKYRNYKEDGKSFELVLLQPNIDPYSEKFEKTTKAKQMQVLTRLTDSLVRASTDFVVGPETVLPGSLWETDSIIRNPYVAPFYKRSLRYPNLRFILGATTFVHFSEEEKKPFSARLNAIDSTWYDAFNAALQIDNTGKVQVYHKSILVPGVEKMPFARYISFLERYMIDLGGITGSLGSQDEPSVFTGVGVKTAPAVCYESVFGEYLNGAVQKGGELIFIITNDGWWKNTPGYRQHLSFARLRAIETRRAIARSANTGISAFINQRGDILQQTSWWTRTALRGNLHANDKLTFYVRYGDYIGRIAAFMAVLLLLYYLSSLITKRNS